MPVYPHKYAVTRWLQVYLLNCNVVREINKYSHSSCLSQKRTRAALQDPLSRPIVVYRHCRSIFSGFSSWFRFKTARQKHILRAVSGLRKTKYFCVYSGTRGIRALLLRHWPVRWETDLDSRAMTSPQDGSRYSCWKKHNQFKNGPSSDSGLSRNKSAVNGRLSTNLRLVGVQWILFMAVVAATAFSRFFCVSIFLFCNFF